MLLLLMMMMLLLLRRRRRRRGCRMLLRYNAKVVQKIVAYVLHRASELHHPTATASSTAPDLGQAEELCSGVARLLQLRNTRQRTEKIRRAGAHQRDYVRRQVGLA